MSDGDFVFKSLLREWDINSKLDIISSFVNDIESDIHNETIKMTLKYLHDILKNKMRDKIEVGQMNINKNTFIIYEHLVTKIHLKNCHYT